MQHIVSLWKVRLCIMHSLSRQVLLPFQWLEAACHGIRAAVLHTLRHLASENLLRLSASETTAIGIIF
jgi:hypothetical protein